MPAETGMEYGKYRFFKSDSSEKQYYCNTKLASGENIIVNDGGICNFRYFNGELSYSDHCICFSSNEYVKYLYYVLLANKEKINKEGFVGGTLKNIDREYFNNFKIKIPDFTAQKQISDFLFVLEHEIELEKNKINQLLNLKKIMLNKLFC